MPIPQKVIEPIAEKKILFKASINKIRNYLFTRLLRLREGFSLITRVKQGGLLLAKFKNTMYLTHIQTSIFRDDRQFKLFLFLSLSSIFDCLLVFYRTYHAEFDWQLIQSFSDFKLYRGAYGTFFFLIWNLFLAWVPYWLAMALDLATRLKPQLSRWSIAFLLGSWLLFFPNAPYIVTDLLHLKERTSMPHWYDVLLFTSFVWTGLLVGFSSLFEIQRFLKSRFSNTFSWFLTTLAIFLSAFGVYMGRFQRWNSWDIIRNPFTLIRQQIHILMNPMDNLGTLGVAVVLSGFMLTGYLTLNALRETVNE
ncbi:MAG: DUF1361 domain-containing protein [Saprospiraceae bacterium]|nr:DUF1361 domain-containing protein [Saprospiraceae bacterium]